MIGNFQTLNHLLHCITQYTFDDVIPISVITSSSLISLPCFLFYIYTCTLLCIQDKHIYYFPQKLSFLVNNKKLLVLFVGLLYLSINFQSGRLVAALTILNYLPAHPAKSTA